MVIISFSLRNNFLLENRHKFQMNVILLFSSQVWNRAGKTASFSISHLCPSAPPVVVGHVVKGWRLVNLLVLLREAKIRLPISALRGAQNHSVCSPNV